MGKSRIWGSVVLDNYTYTVSRTKTNKIVVAIYKLKIFIKKKIKEKIKLIMTSWPEEEFAML